jgi:hypothetical protein
MARTVSPVLVVVVAMVSMTTWWDIGGRPRQFMVKWENSRCSSWVHLEVPGVGRPPQRPHRISAGFGVYHFIQRRQDPRVGLG